jgi:tetratricopeptide (TPR) repeat protein
VGLAEQAGDIGTLGNVLFNMAELVMVSDPAAAAEAARAAAGHSRRAGARHDLGYSITTLGQALVELGDWDAADHEYTHAAQADGLAGNEYLACSRGWLAALRGDLPTAESMLAALPDSLRLSQNPQNRASVSIVEAFTATARGQPRDALRLARAVLDCPLEIKWEWGRWAWPLAARIAHDLRDTATTAELLALIDRQPPGRLAPMQRAERILVRARLSAAEGDPGAADLLAAAVASLRDHSTPYHLAHGLLDHAQQLRELGNLRAAHAAVREARAIAARLRCQPLGDRAKALDYELSQWSKVSLADQ